MLEFKGITFENDYPDDAEAWFCGASFENHYPDEAETWFYWASFENHINNGSYWCGVTFEEMLVLDLDVLFFAQL